MILNFHGIDGKPKNTNYLLLKEMFPETRIYSPQLNYRGMKLENIICKIIDDAKSFDKIDFIVGNSFGGFIATYIAHVFHVPFILVNPFLRPDIDISFEKIIPGYQDENKIILESMLSSFCQDSIVFDNAHIIFGDADEVINTYLSKNILEMFTSVDDITISGGHRLSDDRFKEEFKKMVDKCIV